MPEEFKSMKVLTVEDVEMCLPLDQCLEFMEVEVLGHHIVKETPTSCNYRETSILCTEKQFNALLTIKHSLVDNTPPGAIVG